MQPAFHGYTGQCAPAIVPANIGSLCSASQKLPASTTNSDPKTSIAMNQILPAPDQSLRQAYAALIIELDEHISQLTTNLVNQLHCTAGCASCCMAFSLLPLEAAILQGVLRQRSLVGSASPATCALLHDQLCQVYSARPIICRTQGLPLAYVDVEAGTIEVSACQLNFADDFAFSEEVLLFMDHYNERLATLNHHYCRSHDLPLNKRIPIADL